jgi:hypothetical protein
MTTPKVEPARELAERLLNECGDCEEVDYDAAAALIEADRRAVVAQTLAPQWIPCSERLPKKGELVIAYDEFYGCIGSAFMHREDGGWEFEGQHKDDCGVTHWMPQPGPPVEKVSE